MINKLRNLRRKPEKLPERFKMVTKNCDYCGEEFSYGKYTGSNILRKEPQCPACKGRNVV